MDFDGELLTYLYRIVLFAIAAFLMWSERSRGGHDHPLDNDTLAFATLCFLGIQDYLFLRYTGYYIALWLAVLAISLPAHGYGIYADNVMLALAVVRLIYIYFLRRKPYDNELMVGEKIIDLIGQPATITQFVCRAKPGKLRLDAPSPDSKEIECIANEDIEVGTHVMILEYDCGYLKVTAKLQNRSQKIT